MIKRWLCPTSNKTQTGNDASTKNEIVGFSGGEGTGNKIRRWGNPVPDSLQTENYDNENREGTGFSKDGSVSVGPMRNVCSAADNFQPYDDEIKLQSEIISTANNKGASIMHEDHFASHNQENANLTEDGGVSKSLRRWGCPASSKDVRMGIKARRRVRSAANNLQASNDVNKKDETLAPAED